MLGTFLDMAVMRPLVSGSGLEEYGVSGDPGGVALVYI